MPTLDQGTAAADVGPGSARPPRSRSTTFLEIGMLQRLRRRDVDVPGAISVVGYDDILGTDFCQPSLTIVHTDVEQCRTLVDLVLGPTRPDAPIVIPSQLVVRESTGPVGSGASR
jgi:DNA-binding LacI/PurR family transcriptional regulator